MDFVDLALCICLLRVVLYLYLQWMDLGDKGTIHIASALKANVVLRVLDL